MGNIEKKEIFIYCPRCKSSDISFDGTKKLSCKACSFTYYHNVASAVALILEYDGKFILIKRNKEPSKGKLDLPGGFVDPEETAEEALRREIKEELNINIETLKYVGSCPNVYEYKGVAYNTCDMFFCSEIDTLPTEVDRDEIDELVLIDPVKIPFGEIAFESSKTFLKSFCKESR